MVETIRLESGHTLTGIGGSNPSLSAIFLPKHSAIFPRLNSNAVAWTMEKLPRKNVKVRT